MARRASAMALSRASTLRALAERSHCLIFDLPRLGKGNRIEVYAGTAALPLPRAAAVVGVQERSISRRVFIGDVEYDLSMI